MRTKTKESGWYVIIVHIHSNVFLLFLSSLPRWIFDILKMAYGVFDVIFSSIQFSQDFKVSNGEPWNRKIPVKINRCLFEIKA